MNMEHFPRELVSNVLSRLPVKVLLLCKCVCKSWFNLITDPHFITNYYVAYNNLKHCQSEEEHVLVSYSPYYFRPKTNISVLSWNLNDDPQGLVSSTLLYPPEEYDSDYNYWSNEIMGPCNGIYFLDNYGFPYIMMNPSLREFIVLPQSPSAPCDICYAGFGFDPKTNDYKVVVIIKDGPIRNWNWTTELYSLNSNSWRKLDVALPLPIETWVSSRIFTYVNNCYHWFSIVDECGVKEYAVLAFDMVNESFRKIQVPLKIHYSEEKYYVTLVPFQESATIGAIVRPYSQTYLEGFDVWVMKYYWDEGSWAKQYSVGPVQEINKLVGFYRSKQFLWMDRDQRLRLYGPDSVRNTSELLKWIQDYGSYNSIRAARYMESLVSLRRRKEISHLLFVRVKPTLHTS